MALAVCAVRGPLARRAHPPGGEGVARAGDGRRARAARRAARVGASVSEPRAGAQVCVRAASRARSLVRMVVSGVALALASACSSDSRTVLTVYSPHGKELLEYFEQGFEKAHPDVDVQWVDMG